MAQLKETGITGSLEASGPITGSDGRFTTATISCITGSLVSGSILNIEFDPENYTEGASVDDANWITSTSDVVDVAGTSPYTGQKFLVFRNINAGQRFLQAKAQFTGDVEVSYFTLKSTNGTYDAGNLNLERADTGDDLLLQYSFDGTSWINYTTILLGSTGITQPYSQSGTISVTGITGSYYIRFSQTFSAGSFDHYALKDVSISYDNSVKILEIGTKTVVNNALQVSGTVRGNIQIVDNITDSNYSIDESDFGKTLLFSSSATQGITCSSGLNVGFNVTCIQVGDGNLEFTGSGVSLVNRSAHSSSAGQYSAVSVVTISDSQYLLIGDTQ